MNVTNFSQSFELFLALRLLNGLFLIIALDTLNLYTFFQFLFYEHILTFRTMSCYRFIPRKEITFRVTVATIKNPFLFTFPFNYISFTTFRAFDINMFYNWFCISTIREVTTCHKLAETAHLKHHWMPTILTIFSCRFILYFYFLHFFFCNF